MFVYDNEHVHVALVHPLLIHLLHAADKHQQGFTVSKNFIAAKGDTKDLNISTHDHGIH